MKPEIPQPLAERLSELFQTLPLDQAMTALVPQQPVAGQAGQIVAKLVREPEIASNPLLVAGLWLYVDELDRSHAVSQSVDDASGAYWHGIMHRREGDFSNSHYWFRRTGDHPAMTSMPAEYDAHQFIDDVEQAYQARESPQQLVALQQTEWMNLFAWCANQANS